MAQNDKFESFQLIPELNLSGLLKHLFNERIMLGDLDSRNRVEMAIANDDNEEAGGFSGGAFNPAVALSQSVAGFFAWGDIWVYLLGCLGGGALAAMLFRTVNPA
ncbi:MAG: hypothetical protein AAF399_28200 [Bacteroidota bacterium]